jgi:hypothetical protein
MAKKNEVVVDIKADTSKLDKALQDAEKSMEDLGEAGEKALGGLDNLTGGLASGLLKSVAGARSLIQGMGLLKVALISTGIGAIVVAVGSLAAYFTQTADGAKLLERAMNLLGATFNVLLDRVAQLGKAVVEFFSGDFSKAFETASAAVKGIGDEIREETKAVDGLTQATQRLRASQREIIVETAKQRAEIERLKMASDDVNRTVEQRIKDAERAAALEKRLVNERKAIAQEELRIARAKAAMTQATEEELMRLAELEAEVYNIQQESTTIQTELQNKVNSLRAEAAAAELEAQKAAHDAVMEQAKELNDTNKALQDGVRGLQQVSNDTTRTIIDNSQRIQTSEANLLRDYTKIQADRAKVAVNFASAAIDLVTALQEGQDKNNEKRAKRNFKLSKSISLANAIINTAEGITTALTDKTQPSTILRIIQTATVAAAGAAQIAAIAKSKFESPGPPPPPPPGGGGGGSTAGPPQLDLSFMQGSQTSGFRSYVLASDVNNSMQANQKLRDQASLVG